MKYFIFLTYTVCITIYTVNLNAQADTSGSGFLGNAITINGDVGVYGEMYSMKGQERRRPSSTGRLFLRPTLNLFGTLQIPFEFILSTEGSTARQSMNQFSINPKWSWGSLYAGDFNQDYSDFTLSGIKIRGGGLSINPGGLRFSTAAGFTQRFVPGGSQYGAFERFLFAAKLGYGSEESSYLDVIFLRAKDKMTGDNHVNKSLLLITPNGNDVFEIGSLQSIRWNSYGITSGIKIELSRDGGSTYEIIADNLPNIGFYNWTASGPPTFQAMIKITSINEAGIYDVSDLSFTIGTGVESKIAANLEDIVNPNAVSPQENLVLGTKGQISIIENQLKFEFEAGGSVYSRDVRATLLDQDSADFPTFFSSIFKPRVSTNLDYAYSTALTFNSQVFSTNIKLKRIGPGYTSLGTAYILNDVQEYSIINSLRLGTTGFMLGYIHQNDNVIDQKLFTTSRNIITAGASTSFADFWNANFSINYLTMLNDGPDSLNTDFGSVVLGTGHNFLLSQTELLRSINLNYSYQSSHNRSFQMKNNNSISHNLNLGAGLALYENVSAALTAGFVNSSVLDTINNFIHNYSLVIQHSTLLNKLTNAVSLNTAYSTGDNSTFRTTLTTGYRVSLIDNISLSVSYMSFNGSSLRGGSFDEVLANINYSHQF